ncbi:MAG: DUF4760 domain-containing protein [Terriglobales bacterium]
MAKSTAADAHLILKLYDLRREAELRKARHWWVVTFSPQSADDFMKVSGAFGTPENNWLRQVLGYWGIASSLVHNGALSRELFLEPSFCGEMVLIYVKVKPFLKELREKMKSPEFLGGIESLVLSSKKSREFVKRMETNLGARRKATVEAAKAN